MVIIERGLVIPRYGYHTNLVITKYIMVFIQSIRTWIYVYHTSLVVPRYIMFIIQVESYLYISLLYTSLVVTRFIIDIIKV